MGADMRCQILNVLALLGFVTTVVLAQRSPGLISAINSNVHFGRRFLQATGNTSANLVASPLSAQLALALTSLGARGRTAEQINAAMNIRQNGQQPNYAELISLLQDQSDTMVRIVNRVYVTSQGCALRPEFMQKAKENLRSDAVAVTFGNAATDAAINKWVEDATENRIKNLIPAGLLESDTIAVMVNALYFKGKWLNPFEIESSRPFHVSRIRQVSTTFISKTTIFSENIRYAELSDMSARLIDLPYKGRKFRLVVVLPNEGSSLDNLEAAMSTREIGALRKLTNVSHGQEIFIPKMDLDVSLDLIPPLKKLGINDLFIWTVADLKDVCVSGRDMYISAALQKTFFKLTLEGTEAASGTGVVGRPEAGGPAVPPPPFDANRPFLFYLVHSSTEDQSTVLFSGRYVSP